MIARVYTGGISANYYNVLAGIVLGECLEKGSMLFPKIGFSVILITVGPSI